MKQAKLKDTRFGFKYGAAEIERLDSTEVGDVILSLKTKKQNLKITVSAKGHIKVYDEDFGENMTFLPKTYARME